MTKLQRRMAEHRRRQARRNAMKGGLKNNFNKITALFVMAMMLCSIVKMPVTYAYFTTDVPRESAGFTFLINENKDHESNIGADLIIARPFLFEEENEPEEKDKLTASTETTTRSTLLLSAEEEVQLEGDQEISSCGEFRAPYPGETVQAEITVFQEDFRVENIFLPSVKLLYEEKLSFALESHIVDDLLVATFDLYQVWTWFEDISPVPSDVTLQVSGEGYRDAGDVFFFTGETTIPLKGKYNIQSTKITGPADLFIPAEEPLSHTFQLADQDENIQDAASWFLISAPRGVSLNEESGELQAAPEAAGKTITVEARLESQGRLHVAEREIALHPYPRLEIVTAEAITVPLPGEEHTEPYELHLTPDFAVEELTWVLSPDDITGVYLEEEGQKLTVTGDAQAESFTLLARAVILAEEFTAEKTIELNIIPIGEVTVTGNADRITIPKTEDEPHTFLYTAAVFHRDGEELEGEPVDWYLETGSVTGLTLSADGELTVYPHAEPGIITLVAASVRDPAVEGIKHITLEAPPEPEPEAETSSKDRETEEQAPSLQIQGEKRLLISEDEAQHAYYTAVDEAGEVLENVLWTLLGGEERKDIFLHEESGELIVEPGAAAGIITLQASATVLIDMENGEQAELRLTDELEVELAHSEPEPEPDGEDPEQSEEPDGHAKEEDDETESKDEDEEKEDEDKSGDDKEAAEDKAIDDKDEEEKRAGSDPEEDADAHQDDENTSEAKEDPAGENDSEERESSSEEEDDSESTDDAKVTDATTDNTAAKEEEADADGSVDQQD